MIAPPKRRKGWQWFDAAALLKAVEAIDAPLVSVRRHGAAKASVVNVLKQCGSVVAVHDNGESVEFFDGGTVRHVRSRPFGVPVACAAVSAPVADAAPVAKGKSKGTRKGKA